MSVLKFLDILYPGQPAFIKDDWIQGVPARHVFMAASVEFLSRVRPIEGELRILEIGSWMGSSALTWAQALRKNVGGRGHVVCIDPLQPYFDAEKMKGALSGSDEGVLQSQKALLDSMTALLDEDFVYDVCRHNLRSIPKPTRTTLIRASSEAALPLLQSGSFDIVYVDGSHFFDHVSFDLKEAKRLLKVDGLLCGDDLELQLRDCDEAFARAKADLDFPTDPKSGQQFHPGVTLAVAEEVGLVSNYLGYWVVQKRSEERFIRVDLSQCELTLPEHFPERVKESAVDHLQNDMRQRQARAASTATG